MTLYDLIRAIWCQTGKRAFMKAVDQVQKDTDRAAAMVIEERQRILDKREEN